MYDESIFDVVVVGAGPAGLIAGLACAECGLKTAVIGPVADPADGRTAALLDGSINLLKRLQVWSRISSISEPLIGIRLVDATGSLLRAPEVLFRASEIGLTEFGYNAPNAGLTAALEAACASRLARIVSNGATAFDLGGYRSRYYNQRRRDRVRSAGRGRRWPGLSHAGRREHRCPAWSASPSGHRDDVQAYAAALWDLNRVVSPERTVNRRPQPREHFEFGLG